ncbi:transporter substrate-binding domain-containing protein [Alteromonas sp. 1_MG-2023]|uniref:diguanylate cyclase n=1 Tax=Alteromonas sp. 1_MG-2023 TaxID=3062669 RepID=UPI0026E37E94|nr:transporter substrate-binding domain-containing protein [Alteromonas sp. 1_MG-2023]MDO6567546.1 transporter substrate-binding domain-containing protein [Alteromonas sp. 1_MG-2023]
MVFLILSRCLRLFSIAILLALTFSSEIEAQSVQQQITQPQSLNAKPSRVVTYCVDPNWAPYEAIRNHNHVGVSADYIKLISELSGLTFELVPTDTWEQSLEYVQKGNCQVLSMLNVSDFRKQFLNFSHPYFEAPNILVARSGTPILQGYGGVGHRIVGVVKGYRQVEYISRNYPEIRIKLVESEIDGLTQLSRGEIDVMVGSLMSVNTYINNQKVDNLNIVGYAEPFDSLAFGVNKSFSDIIPTLNSAISRIPEHRKIDIYKRWNNVQVRYERNYFKLLITTAIVLMIVVGLVWRNRTVSQYSRLIKQKNNEIESLQTTLLDRNRTLEFLSAHDTLTGLYNRNHMIQKAEEEISRFQRFHTTASLIVVEIAVKRDSRGELAEFDRENILKQVASQCLATVREVDIVSRFTGEQFIILCPQTNLDSGRVLADRLVECIDQDILTGNTKMQVAAGLSELKESESFTDWFERTTKALYHSKRLGYAMVTVAE